ncbi:5-formyltetrahydrofolate cyclo-ligase [Alsobacter sp. SYSU M60028]|uniref:5-formyltetrahydrofolate cyclo-ligase n=1 Tax=Alsobacter ponti TaxID=2962936 RepID=A0ABT1LF77_9HYPH|nr:5-formyltetrahydrofolate cyclo-ligase [Alsobacter ponti]MCP8940152.1 5-formyltetrahydrofolate cyclo-ligase [Alsobacter ponti]
MTMPPSPLRDIDKAALRAAALARRDALPAETRERYSHAVAERAARLPLGPGPVSGFWPIRSELDPRPLMRLLAARGATLALPRVERPSLSFRKFAFDDPLVSAGFGLSEPPPHAPVVRPAVMLVPLAAFDRRGHRIGYGAGLYDRAIAAAADGAPLLTVGVAFSTQEVPSVPDEAHDRALDWIVTECETIAPGGA